MRKRILLAVIAFALIGAATNAHVGALVLLELIPGLALYLIAPLVVVAIFLGALLMPLALWRAARKTHRQSNADGHEDARAGAQSVASAGDDAHFAATLAGQNSGEHLN